MTNLELIKKIAAENGYNEIDDATVNKIAGTLNAAGVRVASGYEDLIRKELKRYLAEEHVAANESSDDTFRKIDAGLSNGTCPRCGKKMKEVKLADYTPAFYCGGDCRITLWKNKS